MDKKAALRVAAKAIKREIQRVAVDANLHDHYGATYTHAENASKERAKLREALGTIETMLKEG